MWNVRSLFYRSHGQWWIIWLYIGKFSKKKLNDTFIQKNYYYYMRNMEVRKYLQEKALDRKKKFRKRLRSFVLGKKE